MSSFPRLHKLRSRRPLPANETLPSTVIRVRVTLSPATTGRTTMPPRQPSPTGGRANFYIDNLERLRPARRFCRGEKCIRDLKLYRLHRRPIVDLMRDSRKQQVVELLKSLETKDPVPFAYVNPNKYIQHNLQVGPGPAGVAALIQNMPPDASVNTIRVFEDGDYIFAHTEYNFFGPRIGFDIFRFDDGLIVEHWDNLQETATEPSPSGHTMIDGPTEASDRPNRCQQGAHAALRGRPSRRPSRDLSQLLQRYRIHSAQSMGRRSCPWSDCWSTGSGRQGAGRRLQACAYGPWRR